MGQFKPMRKQYPDMTSYPGSGLVENSGSCLCRICGRQCLSLNQLSEHLREHENFTQYESPYFANIPSFAGFSLPSAVGQSDQCTCHYCGKVLDSRESQSLHRCVHISERGFTCLSCRQDFSSVEQLRNHFPLCGSKVTVNKLQCDICKKVLSDESQHEAHVRRHKELQCQTCGKMFKDKYGVNRHMKTHFRDSCHSCSVCKKYFAKETELIKHEQTHDWIKTEIRKFLFPSETDLDCGVCNLQFTSTEELNSHLSHHIAANHTYKCLVCPEQFHGEDSVLSLINHMVTNHGRKTPFMCDECRKYFIDNAKFVRHASCHNPPKKLHCELCSMVFTRQHRLNVHMHKHTGEKPYQCVECPLSFQSPRTLAKHKRCHTGKSLSCDICHQILTDKCSMLDHKARVHTGPELIHCEECGIPYSSKMYLSVHMRNIHGYSEKDRPTEFQCNICGKYCKTSSSLTAHTKTHGTAKYKCDICDKGFISENNLKQHFRVHLSSSGQMTTENYRKCRYCNKEFESRKQCAKHMVTHTKERPHVCEVCGKSYTLKATLAKHMVSYHMTEEDITAVLKCDICGLRCFSVDSLDEHVNTHTLSDENICVECGDSFPRSKDLKEHRKLMHSPNKKRGRPKKTLTENIPTSVGGGGASYQSFPRDQCKSNMFMQYKIEDPQTESKNCLTSYSASCSVPKGNQNTIILPEHVEGSQQRCSNEASQNDSYRGIGGDCVPSRNDAVLSQDHNTHFSVYTPCSSGFPQGENIGQILTQSQDVQKESSSVGDTGVMMEGVQKRNSHCHDNMEGRSGTVHPENENQSLEKNMGHQCTSGMSSSRKTDQRKDIPPVDQLPRCSLCGVCFLDEEFLQAHVKVHTAYVPVKQEKVEEEGDEEPTHRDEKMYKCSVCSQLYSKCSELESHIQTHADKTSDMKMMRFHLVQTSDVHSYVCVHFTDATPACQRSYDSL